MSCSGNPYTLHEAPWQDFQSGSTTCRASTDYMNINTKGGYYKKKSTKKGGDNQLAMDKLANYNNDIVESMSNEETVEGYISKGGAKKTKRSIKKGGDYQLSMDKLANYNNDIVESMSNEEMVEGYMSKGGAKKTKRSIKKGGAESEGATFTHMRYFDTNAILDDYSDNSGFGVKTAYGPSEPLDAGVGLLAPFNSNKAASPLSMTQTGGAKAKKVKKTKKPSIMNHIKSVINKIKSPFKSKPKTTKPKTTKPKTTKPKTTKPKTTKPKPKTTKPKKKSV